MLIDTHCHINMMLKKPFDVLLDPGELKLADAIVNQAVAAGVTTIIGY